ncbi:uncharacterized protein [Atheta coriaria]|uniref:uncharacterized protein n=1 Tax=Dalotia coriaria TaxID=877792 RepID=UPI0031F39442
MVHNQAYSKVEKLQYLKASLRGEALKLINQIAVTDSNYETAWKILEDRYDNRRLLLGQILDRLLDQPSCTQESVKMLKELHDTTKECLEVLKNMHINIDSWGPIIGRIITRKWDQETNKTFEQSLLNPYEIQDLEDVLSFLKKRFQSLELCMPQTLSTESSTRYSAASSACQFCSGKHSLITCFKFKETSAQSRLQFVNSKQLCRNCLKRHQGICQVESRCNKCGKQHHTLIHTDSFVRRPTKKSHTASTHVETNALLATAVVNIPTIHGHMFTARVLIDPGSELSLITENAVQQIGIRKQSARAEVFGIADGEPKISKSKVDVQMYPRFSNSKAFNSELFVMSKVTDTLPSEPLDFNTFKLWENRPLADPYFYRPGKIDILLGVGEVAQLLLDGLEKHSGYMAQNSELGWLISGGWHKSPQISAQVCTISGPQPDLTRFWEFEEVECSIQPTAEAENCEVWYKESTTRSKDGRYTVCLPFKANLGESRSRALVRLRCNAKLRDDYHTFMREYLELHRMRKVNKRDSQLNGYYIPHHAVIQEESSTTKLRVVFDASCQTSSKRSLNECMYVGPQLQNDIADLLLRWRKHAIVCTADYPMVIDIIKKDFYVDDVLSGAEDLKTPKKLQLDFLEVMKKDGFTLRKWSSKNSGLIEDLPKELNDQSTYDVGSSETKKTLGTIWDPQKDTIMVRINRNFSTKITKRGILSDISKIFDPLGWLSSVIIVIKLQIQKLWSDKIHWDENLNEENTDKWQLFCRLLQDIESIQIQRWVSTTTNMELHGFCDASEKAYGAVVYCRSPNGGKTYTNVLQAKSKVAPVKTQVSLPRLELCAAKIIAAVLRKLKTSLDISNENIYAWSDSMITLAWSTGPAEKREICVANRVVDVNQNIPTHAWRHERTHENPADLITRGVAPNKLKESKLWWQGPTWLTQEKETWPTQPMIRKVIPTPSTINILMVKPNSSIINRFSTLHKMLRVLTYCRRFRTRDKDEIKYAEMESTMQTVIRLVQQEGFVGEIKALTTEVESAIQETNALLGKDSAVETKAEYLMMKITATPLHITNTSYTVYDVPNALTAVNYELQQYYELSMDDLKNCYDLGDNRFACSPSSVRKLGFDKNCVVEAIYGNIEPCN